MLLVTGGTGNVGGELVRLRTATGRPTRVMVRSPERADALRGYDCEVVTGDLADPPSVERAMRGVSAVFLACPSGRRQAELECAAVEAAARAGVPVLKLAAIGWDTGGFGRMVDQHSRIIERLAATGLPYTVLAPNEFAQNLLGEAATVQESSVLAQPYADAAISSVDARDVAAVAAQVLDSGDHDGASYLLTGPEALTRGQVAERLSALLGREIRYLAIDPERYGEALLAAGHDPWVVAGRLELAAAYRAGRAAGLTGEVTKATGREPRSVTDFLADHRAAFA